MTTRYFPARQRGHFNHGWLETFHSFSFAGFYHPSLMGFGKLRVVNDDLIAPGAGFGEHPHADMEIVTLPLSGSVAHRDSTGGAGVVSPGEVQVMSAGRGVVHSEYNASPTEPLVLFQIWIEPEAYRLSPRYDQARFDQGGEEGKFQLLVSPFPKASKSPQDTALHIHQQAYISLGDFKASEKFTYSLHARGHGVFLMVVEGQVTIGPHTLHRRDALGLAETSEVTGTMESPGQLLLIEVPME